MIAKIVRILPLLLLLFVFNSQAQPDIAADHKIETMVGEALKYNVSFLWFDRLAEGTIDLTRGDIPGTYLVIMQAKTLGVAAFFTNDRVAKYKTLMKIGMDGLLQPIWHSSHTIRGKKDSRKEKITKLTFDYPAGKVRYQKIKNGKVYADKIYDIEKNKPLLDILSASYNLRLGLYGDLGKEPIIIPTFHRKGTNEIRIEPAPKLSKKDQLFFQGDNIICRILVNPEVFGTDGSENLASYDSKMRPNKVVIKDVIGLGDLRITLNE